MKPNVNQRLAGILQPVFSIRTRADLGVGDVEGVRQMIDWLHHHGVGVLQVLPVNELSDDYSPYNAISAHAIEPRTIAVSPRDIPDLAAQEYLAIATEERVGPLRTGVVNYPATLALKSELLEAAFRGFLESHFQRGTPRGRQFEEFQQANADWLADYTLFRALMELNGNTPVWESWPENHRCPMAVRHWLAGLREWQRDELGRRRLFFSYVQWLAFSQWQAVKVYAESRGIHLMGDMPFGVGKCSADVWANRAIFDLDWCAGAPPEKVFKADPFTTKWGQNWGIPIYRWDQVRREGFRWWRTRLRTLRTVFHMYRIDHVMGLFRVYAFPWAPEQNAEFLPLTEEEAALRTGGRLPGFKPYPDDTEEHRSLNQAQGEEILRFIVENSGDSKVIAEDLGVVPPYVRGTLEALGIPGFRIPMLFREEDRSYSAPGTYPCLSIAQPATHDHPPLAAAWEDAWLAIESGTNIETARAELHRMIEFAGVSVASPPKTFTGPIQRAYTQEMMRSPSWLVSFQYADVFGLKARINTPGSLAPGNWSWRMPHTVDEVDSDPDALAHIQEYARLARESGRGRPG